MSETHLNHSDYFGGKNLAAIAYLPGTFQGSSITFNWEFHSMETFKSFKENLQMAVDLTYKRS